MSTGTTVPYATRRFNEHVIQFTQLYDDLSSGTLDGSAIADLEMKNNLFPNIDYRLYAM
jgi:1,4-alpha-glucan branching enzyme